MAVILEELKLKVSSLDMSDPSVHPGWLSTEARKLLYPTSMKVC
jgi:hypothetical protein